MRLKDVFFSWIAVTAILIFNVTPVRGECFDFSKPIEKGIWTSEALFPTVLVDTAEIQQKSGKLPEGVVWAAVKGYVSRPLDELYNDLKSHESTKSGSASEMVISNVEDPHFKLHQKVRFVVKPFPLITVSWTEDWAFSESQGKGKKKVQGKKILVSYEKTEGTSHIKRLCGNIELIQKGDSKTEVFIYEEAKASRRSREDTVNGIVATLKNLRIARK